MQQYLAQWVARDDHIAETAPVRHPERWHFHDQYMDWYRTFTRRWISRRGAVHEAVVDGLEHLWITLGAQQQLGPADTDTFRETVRSMMHATGGMARRIDDPANMPAFAPLGPTHTSWDLEAEDPLEQPAPPAAQRPRHHRHCSSFFITSILCSISLMYPSFKLSLAVVATSSSAISASFLASNSASFSRIVAFISHLTEFSAATTSNFLSNLHLHLGHAKYLSNLGVINLDARIPQSHFTSGPL
ncbi:hypothetical protein LINGRAPRIM_LOCUS2168 [Linum grandiflorum]